MTRETEMRILTKVTVIAICVSAASMSMAQNSRSDDLEELKIAAIEALISAPPERALPLVNKVLAGKHSDELKERALFILSQIDQEGAQATLLEFAQNSNGELQEEAIRMIGIGGNDEALDNLNAIYENGDSEAREAVLEAFMIAGKKDAVYQLALTATGDDYEEAVDMLAVMGAQDELRELRRQNGASEALIDAYAISQDLDALRELALDGSDPEMQVQAIEAMGIVSGDEVDTILVQIYRDASTNDIREAALDGMLISGNDSGILELYHSSDDPGMKKEMLEYLVVMGSDEVWVLIDAALDGDE